MALVSVVVPVYMAEIFLARCIESILGQTYEKIELVLVNDGSPDRCGAICQSYADRDGRVKVINQDNQGPSAARNRALDICSGDYVLFVDADDYIGPATVEELLQVAGSSGADILLFDHYEVSRGEVRKFPNELWLGMSTEEIKKAILADRIFNGPWGKFFRGSVWESLRFPLGVYYEDLLIMPTVFANAEVAVYAPLQSGGYYYNRGNPSAITAHVTDGALKRYHKFRAWEEHRRVAGSLGWLDIEKWSEVKALREVIRMMYLNVGAQQLTSENIEEGLGYIKRYPRANQGLPKKYRILRWSIVYFPAFFHLYGLVKAGSLRWKAHRHSAKFNTESPGG